MALNILYLFLIVLVLSIVIFFKINKNKINNQKFVTLELKHYDGFDRISIPIDDFTNLKLQATKENLTIEDYFIKLLQEEVENEK